MFTPCSVAEDIPRADEVRALVKDLWDLRIAKLRKSVDHMITEQETYGKVSVSMAMLQQCLDTHIPDIAFYSWIT